MYQQYSLKIISIIGLVATIGIHLFVWLNLSISLVVVLSIIVDTITIIAIIYLLQQVISLRLRITKDPLTAIYNRLYFSYALENEIIRTKRNNHSMVMVLFDVDDFKKVNNSYGHYVGDQILVEVGKIASKVIRQYDTFARLGGDEFAIILPEIDIKGAFDICERIKEKLTSTQLNHKTQITISMGLAVLKNHHDQHTIYQDADHAMYQAKDNGKNQIVVFNQGE